MSSEDSVYVDLAEQFAFERETVTYLWLGDGGMPWMEVTTTLGVLCGALPGHGPRGGRRLVDRRLAALVRNAVDAQPRSPRRFGHLGPRRAWSGIWNMQGACVLRGQTPTGSELDAGVYLDDERHGASPLVVQ